MRVFSDIGSKIIWFIIAVLLLGTGFVWVLRTFLSPPAVSPPPVASVPQSPLPVNSSQSLNPSSPVTSPTPVANSPTANQNTTGEPSPVLVPDSNNSSLEGDTNSSATNNTESSMPALALPDQVALKVPQKLEKGGILRIYDNNDGNENPDPVMYSPSKIVKTQGLSFIHPTRGQFQEVSGYFLVKEDGNYNFTVTPQLDAYLRLSQLRTRINGATLPNVKGGRVALERGWHHISLFAYLRNPDSVGMTWGREGEALMPLTVWREAQQ